METPQQGLGHTSRAICFGRKQVHRRAADRRPTPLLTFLTTRSSSREVVLLDLSCSGARIRGEKLPDAGEELMLAVGPVRTFATVVWSLSRECGVTFDTPLPDTEVGLVYSHVAEGREVDPQILAALEDWRTGFAR